ncbi:hypothetical protein ACXR2U_01020 [Jatrophihabitans sp. YIM 134969]
MRGLRRPAARPAPEWSRQKMLALLVGVAVTVLVLVVGAVLAIVYAVRPSSETAQGRPQNSVDGFSVNGTDVAPGAAAAADPRDVLADAAMPTADADASHPGPVSVADPGSPIDLPPATGAGGAGVPTGFPHSVEGALAQLAAIDQTALQSGTLQGARDVIAAWALPGGPTTTTWSAVRAMAEFLDAAGLSGGGTQQLAIVVSPLMGLVKGAVGTDFVVPCVDFEIDVTLQQTTRGAAADCQRMVWTGDRWMVGSGAEPATPPSVWPDTDLAITVGYRDLRHA